MSKKKEENKTEQQAEYMQPEEANQEKQEKPKKDDKTAELQAKVDYYMDIARRTQADFENFRKRNASVRADGFADGKTEAIKAFLPVLDNIDLAIKHSKEQSAVLEGLKMILRQTEEMLTTLGVAEMGQKGEKFDPNLHEAVVQTPCQEGEQPGEVAEVLRKGYKMGDKVLRYAMVRVTE